MPIWFSGRSFYFHIRWLTCPSFRLVRFSSICVSCIFITSPLQLHLWFTCFISSNWDSEFSSTYSSVFQELDFLSIDIQYAREMWRNEHKSAHLSLFQIVDAPLCHLLNLSFSRQTLHVTLSLCVLYLHNTLPRDQCLWRFISTAFMLMACNVQNFTGFVVPCKQTSVLIFCL